MIAPERHPHASFRLKGPALALGALFACNPVDPPSVLTQDASVPADAWTQDAEPTDVGANPNVCIDTLESTRCPAVYPHDLASLCQEPPNDGVYVGQCGELAGIRFRIGMSSRACCYNSSNVLVGASLSDDIPSYCPKNGVPTSYEMQAGTGCCGAPTFGTRLDCPDAGTAGDPDVGPSDSGPSTCHLGPLDVELMPDPILVGGLLEGTATVAVSSTTTLELDFGGGARVAFTHSMLPFNLSAGARVQATIRMSRPFWVESSLVLREPAPPHRLIAAAWTTGLYEAPPALPELTVAYGVEACEDISYPWSGRRITGTAVSLRVATPLNESVSIQPGDELELTELTVRNGASFRAYDPRDAGSGATDQPTVWNTGFVRRR